MSDTLPAATLGPLAALLAEIEQAPPLPRLLDQILDAACRLTHADAGIIGLYATNAVDPRPLVSATVGLDRVADVLAGWRPPGAGPGPKVHVSPVASTLG